MRRGRKYFGFETEAGRGRVKTDDAAGWEGGEETGKM